MLWFILCIVILVILFFLVKSSIKEIILGLKKYKKLSSSQKDDVFIIIMIFAVPIILIALDYLNLFHSFFPNYFKLTRDYDWLSFVGAYSASIVSAILLIFITEKDRKANTNSIRQSQRPYLDVNYQKISAEWLNKYADEHVENVFNFGLKSDKMLKQEEYLVLCVRNNGASVAIIDTKKTYIQLSYVVDEKVALKDCKMNFAINRYSIKSGDELYIKFSTKELYQDGKLLSTSKILKSKVYYKDLFGTHYLDECMLDESQQIIHDNEEVEE